MYTKIEKDVYYGVEGVTPTIIDWLATQFTSAGWVVDKVATGITRYDNGQGSIYPFRTIRIGRIPLIGTGTYSNTLYSGTHISNGALGVFEHYGWKSTAVGFRYSCTNYDYTNFTFPGYSYLTTSFDMLPTYPYRLAISKFRKNLQGNMGIFWQASLTAELVSMRVGGLELNSSQDDSGVSITINSDHNTRNITFNDVNTSKKLLVYDTYTDNTSSNVSGWLFGATSFTLGTPIALPPMSTELYVHSIATNGESLYYSFYHDWTNGYLYMYTNRGFDTALAVNIQPGTVSAADNSVYDYHRIDYLFQHFAYTPVDLYFSGDQNYFFFNVFSNWTSRYAATNVNEAAFNRNEFLYGGSLDKAVPFTGGQISLGSQYSSSPFYLYYDGNYYGSSITTSVTTKQGYSDMVTPVNFTTTNINLFSGNVSFTPYVAGVNLTLNNNGEYKPLGFVRNLYKFYKATPLQNMTIRQGTKKFATFFKDTNNRYAVEY
jgi:hypothetical protein